MTKINRLQHATDELGVLRKLYYDSFEQTKKKEMDAYQKTLKFIRKQVKDYKLADIEVQQLYTSFFSTLGKFIHSAYNTLKLVLTDVQAYITLRRSPSISNDIQFAKVTKTLVEDQLALSNINFDLQNYRIVDLCRIGACLFKQCSYSSTIKFDKVFEFCKELSKMYNCVPYHNFTHAMNVCLMFYNCYKDAKLAKYIDDFQIFFALIACLGHDVNHQGLNNLYYSKIKSERALRYGYQAILEKMHLSKYMQFLQESNISLFKNLSKTEVERAKRIITKAILATDMAYHFTISDLMKQKVSAAQLQKQGVENPLASLFGIKENKTEDRQFLIQVFVHGCDIGNPCLSYQNYIHWANLICMEFNEQTIQQQQNGVEVTPFLKYTTLSNFYRTQASFSNNVVYPLWVEISTLFPELTPLKSQIISNCKKVEEYAKRKSEEARIIKRRK